MLKTYSFAILVIDVCGLVLKVQRSRRRGDHLYSVNIDLRVISVTVLISHATVAIRTSVVLAERDFFASPTFLFFLFPLTLSFSPH